MATKLINKRVKVVVKQWEIAAFKEKLQSFEKQIEYLNKTSCIPKLTIYSAGTDVCIGRQDPLWHKIVCKYAGNQCLGGSREHWQSSWSVDEGGYHLESMINQDWKGWRGQYKHDNELKYDELPRDVLMTHHTALVNHLKNIHIWYPCHIYNDFTGEMYRP